MFKQDTILVTGSAGFIGFSVAKKLLATGHRVIGVDNFNDYYDVTLKQARHNILKEHNNFIFHYGDLADLTFVKSFLASEPIDKICHLAAQAGVRYSLKNPHAYIQSNIVGFTNLLEEAKNKKIKNFVYASSSSVYGQNKKIPFSTEDNVDQPISLYAATKKSNELIAYSYHHLYNINCTGLRFFTVYGPYGRPDMAYFLFTKTILEGSPIKIFNHGKMERDFTYIDDIVEGIISSLENNLGYQIFNLGNNQPVKLEYFIEILEKELGKKAEKQMVAMQAGDVPVTFADISLAQKKLNFQPKTSIEDGLKKFIAWYKQFYKINAE
ncbi:NAD-dependent epimerase [Candidatus Parcubacteria bacterium]|nr:MAG: NAD-dependent epimerase [Candidatus Parcubacteria bacterium]